MTADAPVPGPLLGLDVGTSAAKGALFAADGTVLSRVRRPLPPLRTDGAAAWQPLEEVAEAAEAALRELLGEAGGAAGVALTTQRDTLILLDGDRRPLTPLISWADRRDRAHPSIWHALGSSREARLLEEAAHARSLASLLCERWTGRAAESESTLSRHLHGSALEALRERTGGRVGLPEIVPPGSGVGSLDAGPTLHQAAGDKNCELLAMDVDRPGRAGLSLGSAVSLGVLASGRPEDVPGTVATAAALEGRWNVETGLTAGMRGGDVLEDWFGPSTEVVSGLDPDVVVVPYFEGALDRPHGRLLIWGLEGDDPAARCRRGWRQGVVAELRRLRPRLEEAAGAEVESVRVGGGGSREPGWARLLADALAVPVEVDAEEGGWEGCRGAVLAVLRRARPDHTPATVPPREARVRTVEPDPEGRSAWERYAERYEALAAAAAGQSIAPRP